AYIYTTCLMAQGAKQLYFLYNPIMKVLVMGFSFAHILIQGANPTMIVCEQRWAMMVETNTLASFNVLVKQMETQNVDLILVEGFKHETLPKIQLHRKEMDKPLPELDLFTLATATDYPLERENLLDINNVEQIAEFVVGVLEG
ncbi:molybdopterin-guanine dinucleotide biosynthesis protein MobB, partial [Glaesserella parasuis]|nr:molybdopterin-guanine dinucleotide biosynthesis protein MobB [Glaesserella parasuis]